MSWKSCVLILIPVAGLTSAARAGDPAAGKIAQARLEFDRLAPKLRVATAKLQRANLDRCVELGRLDHLLAATERELTLRQRELDRFRKQPGTDAFAAALSCRRRCDQLTEAKRQLANRRRELQDEQVAAVAKAGSQTRVLSRTETGDAVWKRVQAVIGEPKRSAPRTQRPVVVCPRPSRQR